MSCKRRRAIKKRTTSKRQARNWVDMPRDVMLLIFLKLGVVDILVNVQNVCTSWRKLAKEPILFHALDFQGAEKYKPNQLISLAKEAVDRSHGQLVKLSSNEAFLGWGDILLYVSHKSSPRSLQIRERTYMLGTVLIEVFRGLDSVEELDLWFPVFLKTAMEQLGRTCPKLTSFRLHIQRAWKKWSDDEVSIIVRNLPQLRRLSLAEFVLTSKGLQTILDGCPLLEHLDLQHCLFEEVEKDLLERCATKIRTVIPSTMSEREFNCFVGQSEKN